MSEKIVQSVWDYTKNAKFYGYRPNYPKRGIQALIDYASTDSSHPLKVADIGAGTGNLCILLRDFKCQVDAVEPNDAMREIGIERTKDDNGVQWIKALGTQTTLQDSLYDWVTFGSSFNVMERHLALQEAHRLLKPNGYFSCMWNHRNLNDPIQRQVEDIIKDLIPAYSRGVRREDQRPIIEEHKHLLDEIFYIEQDFVFHQSLQDYLLAWQSVKNPYWDLETQAGQELFANICKALEGKLPKAFDIGYTMRSWSARRV